MIVITNGVIAVAGMTICTYFLLSDRYDTTSRETIIKLSLWIIMWILLISTSSANSGFYPSWTSTMARATALIINIWQFKPLITNRVKGSV